MLLGCDEDTVGREVQIDDLATIAPADFDTLLPQLRFSTEARDDGVGDSAVVDTFPSALLLGCARAFHHATRLHSKIIWSRDATDRYDQ